MLSFKNICLTPVEQIRYLAPDHENFLTRGLHTGLKRQENARLLGLFQNVLFALIPKKINN